jgi:pimeloyl-ACP methyl ester carboxylesterase
MRSSGSTMRHDETTVTVAGAPVRCYRAGIGVGPRLVLLHGAGPDAAQAAWSPVWTALTPHARLFAPDLPGFGGSPLGATAPSVDGYHAWLLAFLDATRIPRTAIAGLSLGAAVALHTALDTPDRVDRLALLAPSPTDLTAALGRLDRPALLLDTTPDGAPERVAAELVAFLTVPASQ